MKMINKGLVISLEVNEDLEDKIDELLYFL